MPRLPDLTEARRVLCVQPHYDDADLGAGGTLAALADGGAEIHYLTATDDLMGVLDPELSDAEARAQLRREQTAAGACIGVREQHWLDLPDAGDYDYFALRSAVIRHIREIRPDLLFSVDPWLPYESHRDHLQVGHAALEAVLLYGLPRVRTDPEVDRAYAPHALTAVVLYFTTSPNLVFDIERTRERKHRAIDAYRAQFTEEGLRRLHAGLDRREQEWAADHPFTHGEALKVLRPGHLHVNLDPRV